jgi:hypothetical protein
MQLKHRALGRPYYRPLIEYFSSQKLISLVKVAACTPEHRATITTPQTGALVATSTYLWVFGSGLSDRR